MSSKEDSNGDSQENTGEEDKDARASQESKDKDKKRKKKEKRNSLDALLRARKALMEEIRQHLDKPFDVSFNSVETGEIEAVVKAKWEYDQVTSLGLCRQETHSVAHSTMSLFQVYN